MCSVQSDFSAVKVVSKRKLKVLNLSDKVNLILEVEKSPHLKKKTLAKKYGIPPNTLSTILKNKTIILERYASNVNPKCKKLKACAFPKIESALIAWCQTYRIERGNIPISGIMLREKAMDLAKLMGVEEFKASSGWLEKFKARYEHALRSLNGEIEDTTEDSQTGEEEEALAQVLKNYNADNIFSIDESVLFYKCFQSKMVSETEFPSEDKLNKDKLTIVVGANASGTEKLPLLVIGKAKIQLSSEDEKSLPVEYYTNKTAWMTCNLFEHYIRKLDHMFHLKGRKILLFVGNCRAYFEVPDLQAIKLETLLSNLSVMLQPSDKSIVECLKRVYKEHLARMDVEGTKGVNGCIDALQAIKLLSRKWDNDVSQSMIINSFKIQGVLIQQPIYNNGKIPSVDDLSVNEHRSLNVSNSNYVDESINVTSGISNVNIVGTVKTEDNESAEEICVLTESPSDTEVTMAISTIERYIRCRNNVNEELLQHLQKISDFVSTQKRKL